MLCSTHMHTHTHTHTHTPPLHRARVCVCVCVSSTCNDRSHGGGGGFRSSIIAYAHYRTNGTIAPIRIDETGVGEYNVTANAIVEAEDFYTITNAIKQQIQGEDNGFQVVALKSGSSLSYPKIAYQHLQGAARLTLHVANGGAATGTVTVQATRSGLAEQARTIGSCTIAPTGSWTTYHGVACGALQASGTHGTVDLTLTFTGSAVEFARLDSFTVA